MFQCPSCGKGGFKDEVAVAHHMNQPRSGCHTFLDLFNSDENSVHHATNLYYPFSGRKDWELASWLLRLGLSMGKIDSFLSLEIIQGLPLSFSLAKELQGRAEMLPSGPHWMSQVIETKHLTKSPVILYWHDPLDCISNLLNHPSFHDQLDFTPCKVYTTAQQLCCVYSEWMTGDDAWTMQVHIFVCATLLEMNPYIGTILSSDKTNVSMMTGDRTSFNSFVLTALLPVPKFLHKKKRMCGVLEDHLVHQCLDLVLEPLKWAAHEGIMLSDPIGSTTLAQITTAHSKVDSNDIEAFFHEVQKFRSNGIICTVGETEIDFPFSALQPVTGFHHFYGGISKLKQVTGCAQCDIQHSIIVVSVDAVPSAVMTASPWIDDRDIERISTVLAKFHANKHAITAAGFCRGKRNKPINNWYIPKIELMQNIAPSIRNTGITMQWSADTTEHAHITEIKDPARSSNNNNYNSQICHHLDCADKCRRFDLATILLDLRLQTNLDQHLDIDNDVIDFDVDDDDDLSANLLSTVKCPGYARPITNYFAMAKVLQHRKVGTIPLPLCTFIVGRMAFHLAYSPYGHIHPLGGARRAGSNTSLPFEKLQIWFKLQLQDTEFHDTTHMQPAQTLNCIPPSDIWPFGRYDTVIVNNEDGHSWPADGLRGHAIAQIRLIFCPIRKMNTQGAWKDRFLTYVQRFNNSSEREPATHPHLLKRAKRSNGTRIGDVIPVTQLRAPVNVVPHFGASADPHLTQYNGMEHASEFWLNKYWDKNTFFPLSM
ncbi:uncharacterized protein HD556DRAFT_1431393 [Suillus plorans]|uniref:DUF6830 domain-containing protein n=1 Tax=Suillus plorans TaxID=116603 RepID=A0A9P7AXP4_9AGAM|nr:uncharacterized protein HD556DRAFT_1431393 [Suillus plorans]KAG1796320.1 hypothetical protein HD556DRAFT_1431393 [Suillus plorans]